MGALIVRPSVWSRKLVHRLINLSGLHPVLVEIRISGAAPEEEYEFKDSTTMSTEPVWS